MSASTPPIARFFSFKHVCLSLIPLILLLVINFAFFREYFPLFGAFAYLFWVLGARRYFFGAHMRGIKLLKKGNPKNALLEFQKAHDRAVHFSWVDNNRGLIVGSSSSISYQEMALCNIAFCHLELGDRENAIASYEETVRRYPSSPLATRALKLAKGEGASA